MAEPVRLQKFLSNAGFASRRRAESLIVAGRVRVNGAPVTELGTRVDATRDVVEVDGRRVRPRAPEWVVLHKPVGYVTTRFDQVGRRTIYDLVPERLHGLTHVGRLDLDSEGLLLLTNEGDAANRLLHPRHRVEREYEIEVGGVPDERTLQRLQDGVMLEDGLARAVHVGLRGRAGAGSRVSLTLREGRKREVRRMMDAVGHPVRRLVRVRYGPIRLGDLPLGQWRMLSKKEISAIRRIGADR
jgi:23S rRNA pseudouridine2605 synthase